MSANIIVYQEKAVYLCFMLEDLHNLLDTQLIRIAKYSLTLYDLIVPFVILGLARLLIYGISVLIKKIFVRNELDRGRQYAIMQIIKYVIYTIAVVIAMENIGLRVSILLASSAALLVGLGLGLQQIFNDMVSGIILLFEGSLNVGDVVDLGGTIGMVEAIGFRTSSVRTRENIIVTVPNSKLVSDKVINWSHHQEVTRFHINVGVAYGSDTQLVKQLLEDCANHHPEVVDTPGPFVHFSEFGDSALIFELYFWSNRFMTIENVKSDLRFAIDSRFRKNHVTIPFPQRDLHLKSDNPADWPEGKNFSLARKINFRQPFVCRLRLLSICHLLLVCISFITSYYL